jgi:hypothetical protein
MKNINKFNYFMVGIPIALGLFGFAEPACWFFGALFTILTGAFQLVSGMGMLIDSDGRDKAVAWYIALVAIFFSLWIFTDWDWIIVLPPALAVYFSVMVFIKAKEEKI